MKKKEIFHLSKFQMGIKRLYLSENPEKNSCIHLQSASSGIINKREFFWGLICFLFAAVC